MELELRTPDKPRPSWQLEFFFRILKRGNPCQISILADPSKLWV